MMNSDYCSGKTNMGSSSRRSKKGHSEKPKQPQRGLGVAQLEKIRLQEEMGCCLNLSPANIVHQGDPRVLTAYPSPMAPPPSSLSRPLSSPAPSYSFQHNFTMGPSEYGPSNNTMYGSDSRHGTTTGWRPDSIDTYERFQFSQSSTDNKQVLRRDLEDSTWETRSKTRSIGDSFASSSQNPESSQNDQEVDLELRLSF